MDQSTLPQLFLPSNYLRILKKKFSLMPLQKLTVMGADCILTIFARQTSYRPGHIFQGAFSLLQSFAHVSHVINVNVSVAHRYHQFIIQNIHAENLMRLMVRALKRFCASGIPSSNSFVPRSSKQCFYACTLKR